VRAKTGEISWTATFRRGSYGLFEKETMLQRGGSVKAFGIEPGYTWENEMGSTYRAVEVATPGVFRVVERQFRSQRPVKSAYASKHVAFVIPI
jgi:hypothetical protein